MTHFIRFVHSSYLYVLLPLLAVVASVVHLYKRQTRYHYSLGALLKKSTAITQHPYKKMLYALRFCALLLMALLVARPQLVDSRSHVTTEGIDIIIALDVSGSMEARDFEHETRSRIEIAKDEAINFIKKRAHDAIGLVIFGNDALSRCPITHDKRLLEELIKELKIGIIDHEGTKLATALITAASRLKHSNAKSKIIILLTDGAPSKGDMDPKIACDVAQKMGIKIYTVGIGDDQPRMKYIPLCGHMPIPPTVNSELLKTIANATGGSFFLARNAHEMNAIYGIIDQLETTKINTQVFNNYHELGMLGILIVIGLLCSELLLSTFIWFGL
jgi:Ca-activated chloride channel family protein